MVYFEAGGSRFAVDAAELAGVAMGCPFAVYPGLPPGVCGIVQWSGKIFPILDTFVGQENPEIQLLDSTFLFSTGELGGEFAEIALAVPGQVRVLITDTIEKPERLGEVPGVVAVVRDKSGTEALQVNLSKLAS